MLKQKEASEVDKEFQLSKHGQFHALLLKKNNKLFAFLGWTYHQDDYLQTSFYYKRVECDLKHEKAARPFWPPTL